MIGSKRKKDKETGKEITKQNQPALIGAVYVFDVSQTEGAELPQFTERATGDIGEYRETPDRLHHRPRHRALRFTIAATA